MTSGSEINSQINVRFEGTCDHAGARADPAERATDGEVSADGVSKSGAGDSVARLLRVVTMAGETRAAGRARMGEGERAGRAMATGKGEGEGEANSGKAIQGRCKRQDASAHSCCSRRVGTAWGAPGERLGKATEAAAAATALPVPAAWLLSHATLTGLAAVARAVHCLHEQPRPSTSSPPLLLEIFRRVPP